MSLHLNLFADGELLEALPFDQPIEIGRRDKTDPALKPPFVTATADGIKRWVVVDLDARAFPRKVCLLEPLPNEGLRVSNIHSTNEEFFLTDGRPLKPGDSAEIGIPAILTLPEGYRLEIRSKAQMERPETPRSIGSSWQDAMVSILGSGPSPETFSGDGGDILATLTGFSVPSRVDTDPIQVTTVLSWIEHAVAALQCPVNSPRYFWGIAQAVAKIIDMDRAEVILWNGSAWEYSEARRYIRPNHRDEFDGASESLLRKVLETKQVAVYPDPKLGSSAIVGSLLDLHIAIASPILDVQSDDARHSQVLGVLYADRRLNESCDRPAIVLEAEQKLVAILSTAVASSIARMKREQLVTKYQQFFSPKVTEAISQNPVLLEGESAEVTVLFCDIRGFSKVTEKIGPKAAMNWVGETLSELSSIVLDTDGVLVDYVGDEMFAMWGAPEKLPDHAFRAASAAKSMMDIRRKLNDRFASILPMKVNFGIGMCTGEVWVGNTGSKQKFKYGPMGQTVNMGSRIQGLTKQWGVTTLMDQETARYLPSDMPRRRLSKVMVVGMESEIDLYELMSEDRADHELIRGYEAALAVFESGQNFREAVKEFGEMIQRYPEDGPSMVMLVRAVNELVSPSRHFSPVWSATSK